jgi:hypothetical protein
MSEKPSARRLFSFISNPKPQTLKPYSYVHRIASHFASEKQREGKYSREKTRFPSGNRPLVAKAVFRPLDFPKKTRRKPVERIRETRENPEKTPIGDTAKLDCFRQKVLSRRQPISPKLSKRPVGWVER